MFSLIIKWAALKTIIVFITIENLKLILADISNIFLNGKIDYKVYIDMLESFNILELNKLGTSYIFKLLKVLYKLNNLVDNSIKS